MKRSYIISLALLANILAGCETDSFDYKPAEVSFDDIDLIYFSTGSQMMIADGQARLDFIVEAYRTVKMTNEEGERVDSLMPINISNFPEGSVKVFNGSGQEVGMHYTATATSPAQMDFYARIGDKQSATKTVQLRPKPALPAKLYVDVIFHVFELKKTDDTYNPLSYQDVDYDSLVIGLENLNAVMNNQLGTGPNGASANITFRMATKNPSGAALDKPGYNRIEYDHSVIPIASDNWGISNFISYMDGRENETPVASRIWDPNEYLNIVVMPDGARNSMGNTQPQYQIVPAGKQPLEPVTATVLQVITDPSEVPAEGWEYANTCMGVPHTVFRPGANLPISFAPYAGSYYGLYNTNRKIGETDYCTDTQIYDGTGLYNTLLKMGHDGNKFLANNAMDDVRYPSLRNNFTVDQVERIRWVIANCPGRQNGKTE